MEITKAKGLLASVPLYSAKQCQLACKKNKECLQWEWQDNIRTTYKLVRKNVVLLHSHISCRLFKEWNQVVKKTGDITGARRVVSLVGRSAVGSKYSCNIVEGKQQVKIDMKLRNLLSRVGGGGRLD